MCERRCYARRVRHRFARECGRSRRYRPSDLPYLTGRATGLVPVVGGNMDRRVSTRWRRLLQYRFVGRRIITPDARVDPSLFPEDEFPVFCPKCDYLLRGLPDNRCPECGSEFDHGRLLVEQYVNEYGKRFCRGTSRWAWRTWIVAVALAVIAEFIVWFQGWVGRHYANLYLTVPDYAYKAFVFLMVASAVAALLLGSASGWLFLRWTLVSRRKRRQVLAAINRSEHTAAD